MRYAGDGEPVDLVVAPAVKPETPLLRAELDAFLTQVQWQDRREEDPVGIVWSYDAPEDREVVALITASLAYGRVQALRRAAQLALGPLGHAPATALRTGTTWPQLDGFVYRMTKGDDVAALFRAIGRALDRHGSLQALFREAYRDTDTDLRPALTHFVHRLREYGGSQSRGFHYLLADPAKGGACKRLNLFLRWMIRGPDDIDLGLWDFPRSLLAMPLDTHITRIGRYLGLCSRRTVDWKLALEVRDSLVELDPDDPLKYDFALCHMGISGQCPTRREPSICVSCPIERICTL